MHKIITIIVTYNGSKWIDRCIRSLINSTLQNHIITIDNASTDDTVRYIRDKYKEVDIIKTGNNLGFGKANNIGIKEAINYGADYFFLLNQDAWIETDTLEKLIAVFRNNPDAGIVSPIHLNGNYSGLDKGFASYLAPGITPDIISDMFLKKIKPHYKTEFINAAAWLISRKCIEKVGVFDTTLFSHYGEDDNYCQRVRYHNFGIYLATGTTICHDREDRDTKRPQIFEEQNKNLNRKIYFSNPFLDSSLIDEQINSLKRKSRSKIIKYSLALNFRKLTDFMHNNKEEMELYKIIKQSRESYKTNGLKWLNQ